MVYIFFSPWFVYLTFSWNKSFWDMFSNPAVRRGIIINLDQLKINLSLSFFSLYARIISITRLVRSKQQTRKKVNLKLPLKFHHIFIYYIRWSADGYAFYYWKDEKLKLFIIYKVVKYGFIMYRGIYIMRITTL